MICQVEMLEEVDDNSPEVRHSKFVQKPARAADLGGKRRVASVQVQQLAKDVCASFKDLIQLNIKMKRLQASSCVVLLSVNLQLLLGLVRRL